MHWSQLSLLSLAVCAILAGKSGNPDQVRILGRVLSADKRPLAGATVSIRALNIGGVSLADGRYVLAVPMSAVPVEQITLVARADGYCTAAFQLLDQLSPSRARLRARSGVASVELRERDRRPRAVRCSTLSYGVL